MAALGFVNWIINANEYSDNLAIHYGQTTFGVRMASSDARGLEIDFQQRPSAPFRPGRATHPTRSKDRVGPWFPP